MEFFHEMLPHKAKTKMTSANLAIIIAPNILRCRVESVHQIMRDAPHVQSVIRCMIDDFHSLFQVFAPRAPHIVDRCIAHLTPP